MSIAEKQDEIVEELNLFQFDQDVTEYLINLGRRLPPMRVEDQIEENEIKGCQSKAWLQARKTDGKIFYTAQSQSQIVKGVIAIFLRILSGEHADEILKADLSFLNDTKLKSLLTPTRANTLNLVPLKMKQRALEFAARP